MVVVEMPQSKPVITGGHQELPGAPKMKYKPGDVLNLTCTSAPSNPPAQLEWRLNDKKVCISNDIACIKIYSDGTTWNTQKFTRNITMLFLCVSMLVFSDMDGAFFEKETI